MMLLTLLCYSPCHLSVVVISCYFQTPFWKKSTNFHGDVQMLIGTSNNSKCEIKEEIIRNRWVKSDFSAYWCRCQYMCMSNFSLLADLTFCPVVKTEAKLKPLLLLYAKHEPLVFNKMGSYLSVNKADGTVYHFLCLKPLGNSAVGIILIGNTFVKFWV